MSASGMFRAEYKEAAISTRTMDPSGRDGRRRDQASAAATITRTTRNGQNIASWKLGDMYSSVRFTMRPGYCDNTATEVPPLGFNKLATPDTATTGRSCLR